MKGLYSCEIIEFDDIQRRELARYFIKNYKQITFNEEDEDLYIGDFLYRYILKNLKLKFELDDYLDEFLIIKFLLSLSDNDVWDIFKTCAYIFNYMEHPDFYNQYDVMYFTFSIILKNIYNKDIELNDDKFYKVLKEIL